MNKKFSILMILLFSMVPALSGSNEKIPLTAEIIAEAQEIIGLDFSKTERDSMLKEMTGNLDSYIKLRRIKINNAVPPAFQFNPIPISIEGSINGKRRKIKLSKPVNLKVAGSIEKLAFASVRDLAEMIRNRKVTSTELTKMYISRLKKYGESLECTITLTEELAFEQAARADEEIADGYYRGPLHGIPYGLKDLFAVKGYPTTWGAAPYKEQIIDEDAGVVKKLEEAGAVLAAKLSMGALAWGDVWFGGKTRNPWNLDQGSSGSSAGPASAAAAGLVGFAIGTETWGSIVSPSTRCGVTGLRPTYGRVSRAGAMALSWTMDKVGPICRTAEDCAIVFDAIKGPDGIDQTLVDAPFNYRPDVDLKKLRIGYLKNLFDEDYPNKQNDAASLDVFRKMGVKLIPLNLPDYPVDALAFILSAEAAAAFDDLTRSGRDDLMVRQIKNAWPNVFRAARFIPAVEYIQANRLRYMIIQDMEKLNVDLYLAPSFGGHNLLLTNLTGHPCVVVPNGFTEKGGPASISLVGRLFGEAYIIAAANAYQAATGFDEMHPPGFE